MNYYSVLAAVMVAVVTSTATYSGEAFNTQAKKAKPTKNQKTPKYHYPAERTATRVDKDGFLVVPRFYPAFFLGVDFTAGAARNSLMYVNNGLPAFPPGNNYDIYTIKNRSFYSLGALIGYRWENTSEWLAAWSIAFRYRHLFKQEIRGSIFQNSVFENFMYALRTQSNTFMAVGKLNVLRVKSFMPYVSGGVGGAFNRFSRYFELGTIKRANPEFRTLTSQTFTYTLGTGLDIQLSRELTLSVGYEFQDYGLIRTGFGVGIWSGQSLSQNSFRTNSLILGFDYLFMG